MTYWIHPDAESGLGDATVYYAQHASLRVAQAFLAEFERVRDLLIENQQRAPYGDFGFRIYHFDRSPYSVIYDEGPQGPHIYLCDCPSAPRAWVLDGSQIVFARC